MKKDDYEIKYAICPIYEKPKSKKIVGYMVSKVYIIEKQEKYKVFFPFKAYPNRLTTQYTKIAYNIDKNNLEEIDQVFDSYEEAKEQANFQNELFKYPIDNEIIQQALLVLEHEMVVKEDNKKLIKNREN